MPRRCLRPCAAALVLGLVLPAAAAAQQGMTLGYYVEETAGCADASNATLALLHARGMNSARTFCEFTAVTQRAGNVYDYTERCTEISSGEVYDNAGAFELLAQDRLRLFGEGWEVVMVYCPQASLPEPWRDNDISDLLN